MISIIPDRQFEFFSLGPKGEIRKAVILATISSIVFTFMKNNPKAKIIAIGQLPGKTRLYQMAINKHFHEIAFDFIVEGLDGDSWELFKRDKNYDALLVRAKSIF